MPEQCPAFGDEHNGNLFILSLAIVEKPLNIHPFTKAALRISPILAEAAVMNGLAEIIRMNELKMRNTVLGCPWSNTQLWIIKSSFDSVNCFPEMWNWMKGKQTKPKKARMSMTLQLRSTWPGVDTTHLQELGVLCQGSCNHRSMGTQHFSGILR